MKMVLFFLSAFFFSQGFASSWLDFSPHGLLTDSIILEKSPQTIASPDSGSRENTVNELFMIGKKVLKRNDYTHSKYPPFKGHWSGFYYGFVNFAHTDYSMYPPADNSFMDLDWTHSFVMQFNILQHNINLVPRNNLGIVCGLGLEYQRLRFENNFTSISLSNHQIYPVSLNNDPEMASIKRSTFKILYLSIPLLMEVQFPAAKRKKLYVSGGVMGGVRMHSKTKVVYNDPQGSKHKKKEKNNFNMVPFKADVVGKIGYRHINVWGSYTLTQLFKSNKGPELHTYCVGLGITF